MVQPGGGGVSNALGRLCNVRPFYIERAGPLEPALGQQCDASRLCEAGPASGESSGLAALVVVVAVVAVFGVAVGRRRSPTAGAQHRCSSTVTLLLRLALDPPQLRLDWV